MSVNRSRKSLLSMPASPLRFPPTERMQVLNEIRKLTWYTLSCRIIARLHNKRAKAAQPAVKIGDIVLCRWRPAEFAWRNQLHGGAKFAPKWSEPRRVIGLSGPQNSRVHLKSIWYRSRAHEMSRDDIRVIPPTEHESALRANLKYVIQMLESHCELHPKTPAPFPLSQVLLNTQQPAQAQEEGSRETKSEAGPAPTASEGELWPTNLALVQKFSPVQASSSSISRQQH
eukprot:GHVU01104142.1.p1 GENE.GHVU01104142.1~~GHVU01104142.1.p1  ORF type:complete len:229 (-),score=15.05 GHVU01104142.1:916-1602(-)